MKINACKLCDRMHFPPEECAPVADLRDQLAMRLHGEFCDGRHDECSGPCWIAWRPEADLLMGDVTRALAQAWESGAHDGSRGLLPDVERAHRNPYIPHGDLCGCAYCRSAAMGGGR